MSATLSPANTPPPALMEMVNHTRGLYVHLLKEATGAELTHGSCFYAANLVAELTRKFLRVEAAVCGGDGEGDGGYYDAAGMGHGHYWAEVIDGSRHHWVIDITADQFGDVPVLVEPAAAVRTKYRLGSRVLIAAHVQDQWADVFGFPGPASPR